MCSRRLNIDVYRRISTYIHVYRRIPSYTDVYRRISTYRLERVSVALRALRAVLVVDDVAAKCDDSWAYARRAFGALELAGSLERRLRPPNKDL